MASVASTYAHAFADVVFDAHLDAGRAINGLRQMATLFGQSLESGRIRLFPLIRNADCWMPSSSAQASTGRSVI